MEALPAFLRGFGRFQGVRGFDAMDNQRFTAATVASMTALFRYRPAGALNIASSRVSASVPAGNRLRMLESRPSSSSIVKP